ncbi:MAG: hypothetical protein IJS50_04575 [Desulfovibrio sp.]|nr:hypothetical protein [Desulfovibrio sp.]
MLKRLLPVLLLLLTCACDGDSAQINLFDQYYYGMSFKDVQERSQAVYCKDNLDSLCRPNPVPFFRESWYQRFLFRRDRLYAVQLISQSPDKVQPIINGWLDAGYRFLPVAITSGGKQLDLFAAIKVAGKEGARKAVNSFTKATAQDLQCVYLYLDLLDHENSLDSFKSFREILRKGPRQLVGIEQMVDEKEMVLSFIAPIAEYQDKGLPKP